MYKTVKRCLRNEREGYLYVLNLSKLA